MDVFGVMDALGVVDLLGVVDVLGVTEDLRVKLHAKVFAVADAVVPEGAKERPRHCPIFEFRNQKL